MASSAPKNQIGQGRDRAKLLLDLNNSAISNTSDKLFSALEAGEGSLYLRQSIDTVLHQLAAWATVDYDWKSLRKLSGIKAKLAYFIGSRYGHEVDNGASALIATSTDTVSVDEDLLRDVLDKTITELEERLISNQDFTESWILRHAAFNRFEIKPEMKTSEKTALANLANAMQKFAATKGFDTVAEAMHFQDESEVQKIMKISEGIAMMTNAGETVDAKLVEQFDVFAEKIKPLKELDKHYKHMMSVLNMVHRTGRKAYASMISTGQEKKLTGALKDMGIDNPNSLILDANKADSSDEQYLENQLYSLKRKDPSAFAAALRKNVMTEREFDAWYTSYYGYLSVEKAKKDFDTQKAVTFGNRLKAFEMDVNSWRWLARERVLSVHARMGGDPIDFATDADFQFADSYFNKFKDLFYAAERDADEALDGGHYQQMRDIVAAILRRRVPSLTMGNRRRFGSRLRRIIGRLGNPQLQARLTRAYHRADDAEILAMVIMAQNESTNIMFYHDKDPFQKKEGLLTRLSKLVGRVEVGRLAVRQTISKPLNTVLRLSEGATGLTLKAGNKIVSNTGRLLTRAPGGILEKINKAIEWQGVRDKGGKEWKFKWRKTPAYAVWLASRPAEAILKQANKAFNYTNTYGNKMMDDARQKTVQMLQSGFNDNNINSIYQWFTYAVDGATSMLGRGTSYIGNAEYNRRNVSQKRSVLCAFFEAAAREEDLAELMESCDLANMLNLKESGPYLFDKDGRVQSVDASAKREYADDLTGAADYMRDNASKTAQELQKQFDDYQNSLQTKQQEILNSMLSADAAQMERLSSSLSLVEKKLEVTDDSMPHAIAMLNSFQSLVAGTIDEAAFNTQVDTQYTNFITTVVDPNATALTAATGEVARLEADLTNAKRAVTRCEGDLDAAKRPGRGVAVDPTRVAAAQTALDAAYDTIATVTTNLSTKKGEVSVLKNTQTSLKARAAWMQKVKALALKLETNRATNRAANPALYAKNLKQAVDSLSLTFRKETPPPASTTS